jgi:hypothetical protein
VTLDKGQSGGALMPRRGPPLLRKALFAPPCVGQVPKPVTLLLLLTVRQRPPPNTAYKPRDSVSYELVVAVQDGVALHIDDAAEALMAPGAAAPLVAASGPSAPPAPNVFLHVGAIRFQVSGRVFAPAHMH